MTRTHPSRRTQRRGAALAAAAVGLALASVAAAQQGGSIVVPQQPAQGGGIVSQPLGPVTMKAPQPGEQATPGAAPLLPNGVAAGPATDAAGNSLDRGDRFKLAPDSGGVYAPTVVPELIPPVATVMAQGARLRALDKLTGQTRTVDIPAGQEMVVERLRILVDSCRAPEDNSQHGTMAFLQIWDTKFATGKPAFSGWMLAESPALSAMDHPRYDVWLISCTTSAGEAPVAKP